jgi:hypothetical protein
MNKLFPILSVVILTLTFAASSAFAGSCGGCGGDHEGKKDKEAEVSNS